LCHIGKDVDEAALEVVEKIQSNHTAIRGKVAEFERFFSAANFTSSEEKYDDSDSNLEEKKLDANDSQRDALMQFLRGKQFEFVDLSNEPFRFSEEVSQATGAVPNKARLMRIKKELAILSHAFPDGIFVRVNEERPDTLKVLITGPGDTPYENGLFIFDLYLSVDLNLARSWLGCGKLRFASTCRFSASHDSVRGALLQ